jgi:hypothetical protein
MDSNVRPLERAFELAKSGDYSSVTNIKRQLQQEGYDSAQINGPSLLRQLSKIIKTASSKRAERTTSPERPTRDGSRD